MPLRARLSDGLGRTSGLDAKGKAALTAHPRETCQSSCRWSRKEAAQTWIDQGQFRSSVPACLSLHAPAERGARRRNRAKARRTKMPRHCCHRRPAHRETRQSPRRPAGSLLVSALPYLPSPQFARPNVEAELRAAPCRRESARAEYEGTSHLQATASKRQDWWSESSICSHVERGSPWTRIPKFQRCA